MKLIELFFLLYLMLLLSCVLLFIISQILNTLVLFLLQSRSWQIFTLKDHIVKYFKLYRPTRKIDVYWIWWNSKYKNNWAQFFGDIFLMRWSEGFFLGGLINCRLMLVFPIIKISHKSLPVKADLQWDFVFLLYKYFFRQILPNTNVSLYIYFNLRVVITWKPFMEFISIFSCYLPFSPSFNMPLHCRLKYFQLSCTSIWILKYGNFLCSCNEV